MTQKPRAGADEEVWSSIIAVTDSTQCPGGHCYAAVPARNSLRKCEICWQKGGGAVTRGRRFEARTSMLCGGARAASAVKPTKATSGIVHMPTGYRAASARSASGEQSAAAAPVDAMSSSSPPMGAVAPHERRGAAGSSSAVNMASTADSA